MTGKILEITRYPNAGGAMKKPIILNAKSVVAEFVKDADKVELTVLVTTSMAIMLALTETNPLISVIGLYRPMKVLNQTIPTFLLHFYVPHLLKIKIKRKRCIVIQLTVII